MIDPAAILAAVGVWISFQTVSVSTPQPPQGRRLMPKPSLPRSNGLTPEQFC